MLKRSAISWANYNLDRDACKRSSADKETYQFIQAWLNCLFSRNNDNNMTFGMWRWSCKHGDLNGHGIAGVGVMITTATTTMEVRLTRKY
mmetsp:Transcript_2002/g.3548  ORF Transcript_2002/g.3548 Transcript_2002/m.3548 type:complete len:90 (+) Transcript_2002:116-385(+)